MDALHPRARAAFRVGTFLLLISPLVALLGGGRWASQQTDRHGPWLARALELALDWPPGSVYLSEVYLDESRRVHLSELTLLPPMPQAPRVHLQRAEADFPPLDRLQHHREVALGQVHLVGLEIDAPMQRPAPPLPDALHAPIHLTAEALILTQGRYAAPEDPPLSPVKVEGIEGRLRDVRWTPQLRQFRGHGRAEIRQMDLGNLQVQALQIPTLTLDGTQLEFEEARFGYGQTEGHASGRIEGIDQRPRVEIQVQVRGDRVETAIQTATGAPSPVRGTLSASVTLRSGGELPRGAAHFEGWMHLSDANLYVGQDLGTLPKILIDIAPWFRRTGDGWIQIGTLRGEARFGRGWVELTRLERPSDRHRPLQAWGTLREGEVELYVRAVPKRSPDERAGIGVRIGGTLEALRLRLARRDELQSAPRTFGL